jgi:hypothetical protein
MMKVRKNSFSFRNSFRIKIQNLFIIKVMITETESLKYEKKVIFNLKILSALLMLFMLKQAFV